ncbi:hypothetical protein C8K15_13821 [Paenisporosarcina sp. OV554]|nr:hypothetical protein C8K15_13821 [Paenisporosarcina sp. OV554]
MLSKIIRFFALLILFGVVYDFFIRKSFKEMESGPVNQNAEQAKRVIKRINVMSIPSNVSLFEGTAKRIQKLGESARFAFPFFVIINKKL